MVCLRSSADSYVGCDAARLDQTGTAAAFCFLRQPSGPKRAEAGGKEREGDWDRGWERSASKCCFSHKMLDEHQKLRASWVIADSADYVESELLVEGGRLKIMGLNYDLLALPRFGLLLCSTHQHGALALPTHIL